MSGLSEWPEDPLEKNRDTKAVMNDGKKFNRKERPRKPVNLELTCNVAIPIYLNTMRISFIACSNWF